MSTLKHSVLLKENTSKDITRANTGVRDIYSRATSGVKEKSSSKTSLQKYVIKPPKSAINVFKSDNFSSLQTIKRPKTLKKEDYKDTRDRDRDNNLDYKDHENVYRDYKDDEILMNDIHMNDIQIKVTNKVEKSNMSSHVTNIPQNRYALSSKNRNLKVNNKNEKHDNNNNLLSESEVTQKLDDYRMILNQNLLKLLSEQRVKEQEREVILSQTTNEKEKNKLINQFNNERTIASNKIVIFNE